MFLYKNHRRVFVLLRPTGVRQKAKIPSDKFTVGIAIYTGVNTISRNVGTIFMGPTRTYKVSDLSLIMDPSNVCRKRRITLNVFFPNSNCNEILLHKQ